MFSYTLALALLLCWCHAQPPSLELSWTWLGESKTMYPPPVYGEKGVPNTANVPGARHGASGYYDNIKREFWMFGGFGMSNTMMGTFFTLLFVTVIVY